MDLTVIAPNDNVGVSLENGHKYALRGISRGEAVIKYGFKIGEATADIPKGSPVHTENLRTCLTADADFVFDPCEAVAPGVAQAPMIYAYRRKNGDIGIRNDVFVIPTVGCVNASARRIAEMTGAIALTHPYGCSQLGGDLDRTRDVLCGLIKNPNAGGVLVLGLGCENLGIDSLKEALGEYDGERVVFLNSADIPDETADGVAAVNRLKDLVSKDARVPVPASMLRVGLKCGGSDGLSGITANPLVGRIADRLTSFGASCALTEVPEMFGAEQALFPRCENEEVFEKAVALVSGFKKYYTDHGQPVSENPSPGNKAGGISTLEEKSLGCVQKGGRASITDVISYGERIKKPGLTLVDGPGNDLVAVTNLAAAGCHLILFTTGRGTPLGGPVPTLKIATNTALFERKRGWTDLDAQRFLSDPGGAERELFELLLETACGKQTANEINGNRDIAIFKDGVTL